MVRKSNFESLTNLCLQNPEKNLFILMLSVCLYLYICMFLCMYVTPVYGSAGKRLKTQRNSYVTVTFELSFILFLLPTFGHVARVAYICFEANVRKHMPNYRALFCPISHPLASGTHVTTVDNIMNYTANIAYILWRKREEKIAYLETTANFTRH
jgi:hypothetical protein